MRAAQRVGRLAIDGMDEHQQRLDVVSFRKLDLAPGQERLEILLDRLLAVKSDYLPKPGALFNIARQTLGGLEIGVGFLDPLTQQGLRVRITRQHK